MQINFSSVYSSEITLARVFAWLAKIGIGVGVGRPIGWYQMHQCAALDILEEHAKKAGCESGEFRVKNGVIQSLKIEQSTDLRAQGRMKNRWVDLISVREGFAEADRRARR